MKLTIKKQFKTLNIIYLSVLISMSLVAVFSVIYTFKSGALPVFGEEDQGYLKSIVIIALLIGIPVSHIFYHKKLKHIDTSLPLHKKITLFQPAFIVRIVMLEAIGLLAIIVHLITADKSFLYMFGVVFVLYIIHAPTKQRLINDLEMTQEEEDELLS